MNFASFIIRPVMRALFPKAPEWMVMVILDLVPEVVDVVREVREDQKLDVTDIIKRVRSIIDNAFDVIPEWETLGEDGRDEILNGLTRLALWLYEISDKVDGKVTPAQVKRATAKIRRHVRREAA